MASVYTQRPDKRAWAILMYPSSEMARSGKIYIHTWLGKVRDGEKKGPLLLSPLVEIFKGAFDGFNNI